MMFELAEVVDHRITLKQHALSGFAKTFLHIHPRAAHLFDCHALTVLSEKRPQWPLMLQPGWGTDGVTTRMNLGRVWYRPASAVGTIPHAPAKYNFPAGQCHEGSSSSRSVNGSASSCYILPYEIHQISLQVQHLNFIVASSIIRLITTAIVALCAFQPHYV
jgi:hypothetical protein